MNEILAKIGVDTNALLKWNAKQKFSGAVKARMYNKLSSFLDNGVPLPKALEIMLLHASDDGKKPNTPTAIVLKAWLAQIRNGKSLGIAVKGWVPDNDRIIIEAGERAGTLSGALKNALFIEKSNKQIRSAVKKGIAYPMVLIGVAMGLLLMYGLYIIPGYEDIIPREKWVGGAASMIIVSDFVNFWLIPTVLVTGAIVATIMYTLPKWIGPTRTKFDKFAPWSLYRLINGAGFMLSVSSLIKAGVQLPEILKILKKDSTPWYNEKISAAKKHVDNGVSLGQALHLAGHHFPEKETVMDLRAFADMEGFEEKLEQMGRDWVIDSVLKVESQMAVFKNIAIIIMALVFGTMIAGTASINLQLMAAGTG